jgi:hypothetical protein
MIIQGRESPGHNLRMHITIVQLELEKCGERKPKKNNPLIYG